MKNEVSLAEFTEAMKEVAERHPVVTINMHPAELFGLIGSLQLAMRHPTFPETMRVICVKFIDDIKPLFGPTVENVIEMGFDVTFDE